MSSVLTYSQVSKLKCPLLSHTCTVLFNGIEPTNHEKACHIYAMNFTQMTPQKIRSNQRYLVAGRDEQGKRSTRSRILEASYPQVPIFPLCGFPNKFVFWIPIWNFASFFIELEARPVVWVEAAVVASATVSDVHQRVGNLGAISKQLQVRALRYLLFRRNEWIC